MSKSFDEIRVFCIGHTKVDRETVRLWLDDLGANEFEVPEDDVITDPALLVALAAKQCYLSFQPGLNPNVTKVRQDMVEYLDNVMKQKHGSVLEHAVFTFAINGCSRVFTGEMNRHRVGMAISERSMRYIRYDKIEFWMPTCFRDAPDDPTTLRFKKQRSRGVLIRAFNHDESMMKDFQEIWAEELAPESTFHAKKVLTSAFRRGIGMGIATGGLWSGNVRALRHIISLRTDPSAEEEMVHVMRKIGLFMLEQCEELFGDFSTREDGAMIPGYWKV